MTLRDGQKMIWDVATASLIEDGAAAIVADGASSNYYDTGGAAIKGEIYLNVTACGVTGGDEKYAIYVECSDVAAFNASIIRTGYLELGDAAAIIGDEDKTTGNYAIPFTNQMNGLIYQYIRLYVDVTGASPTITFTAYMGKAL